LRLRFKFAVLVVGIIVIPIFVTILVFAVRLWVSRRTEPAFNYGRVSSWLREEPSPEAGQAPASPRLLESLERFAAHRPPGVELLILDRDGTALISSISEFPAGAPVGQGRLLDYIRRSSERYHIQFEEPGGARESGLLMLLALPRPHGSFGPRLRSRTLEAGLYGMIALVVFSAVMSFLIAGSLNRSLLTLEGATRRIAEGDLEFQLSPRGKDEIASLTRSFETMRRALKEEQARRARFIMGVSHDLRTPLALIQGYAEAIADGLAADPQVHDRYIGVILEKTRLLEGLINNLIDFVRLDTGEWRLKFRRVALGSFLQDLARRFAEDAEILKRQFQARIDLPDSAAVSMDEELFYRALENLIGNAIRYSAEGSRIELAARLESGKALIAVSDTGIGIPAEELPRVFEPFYRATNSRREQGFGLGLSTVKTIVESHGWAIEAASEVGKGTTFTIRAELAEPAAG
jgi:signal transduction histidine kinase